MASVAQYLTNFNGFLIRCNLVSEKAKITAPERQSFEGGGCLVGYAARHIGRALRRERPYVSFRFAEFCGKGMLLCGARDFVNIKKQDCAKHSPVFYKTEIISPAR